MTFGSENARSIETDAMAGSRVKALGTCARLEAALPFSPRFFSGGRLDRVEGGKFGVELEYSVVLLCQERVGEFSVGKMLEYDGIIEES